MKKFLARLMLLAVIMLMVVVVMHVVAVWRRQDELEAVYTVSPSTEVLFLGSSQVGCAIAEDPTGRVRKLWVSDTIAPSCLMRLRELERRGQLDRLKAVVVPFNIHSVMAQSERGYLWAWYLELPVAWRYLDMLPYGKLDLAWYMLRNLRFPFRMILSEVPPDRDALAARPEAYRRKMLAQFRQTSGTESGSWFSRPRCCRTTSATFPRRRCAKWKATRNVCATWASGISSRRLNSTNGISSTTSTSSSPAQRSSRSSCFAS